MTTATEETNQNFVKAPSLPQAAVLLILLNLIVFAQSVTFGYIYLDDRLYVTENAHVLNGLTADGLRYAFSTEPAPMSNPLALVSHMLDVELFGTEPAGHHAVNVLLHTCNSVLLLLVLVSATRNYWCSLFVALVFAVHPLHVENVAWISSRKDLLSTLFWLLALLAYVGYTRDRSFGRIALVAGLFTLSLLAKPMAVTFPFVLLLFDLWPLRRIEFGSTAIQCVLRLVGEKIPLFFITVVASYATWYLQHTGGATQDLSQLPLTTRLLNAVASYGVYVKQTLWPSGLAIFYPLQTPVPLSQVLLGTGVLLAGTVAAISGLKHTPWIFTGWFMFVGILVPVIGLVQVGEQGHADRYMYLPLVGLSVAVVWTFARQLEKSRAVYRRLAATGAAAVVALLAILSFRQTLLWANSEPLFRHALAVTEKNAFIELNLGGYYTDARRDELAAHHLRRALELEPANPKGYYNLAVIEMRNGRVQAAEALLASAIEIAPDYLRARNMLAHALLLLNKPKAAEEMAAQIQARAPDSAYGYVYEGMALAVQNRNDEAVAKLAKAVKLEPRDPWIRARLAYQLLRLNRREEAAAEYRQVLSLGGTEIEDWYYAGLAFEGIGDAPAAARVYQEILGRNPGYAPASERLNALRSR